MLPDGRELYKSAIGEIEIATSHEKIISCHFISIFSAELIGPNALTGEACKQLKAYFDGKLRIFNLPLYYEGTELQLQVMKFLETIKYGESLSYLDVANKLSIQSGSRAVGNMIGRNPLLILVPCHRVLGSNGKITGYAGGLERKRWLLEHELNNSPKADRLF